MNIPATALAISILAFAGAQPVSAESPEAPSQWPVFGGNQAGQRYSPLKEIAKDNVANLQPVWTYHHGDFSPGDATRGGAHGATAFEATPLVVDDVLYFCTPYNRIIALDPASGQERWRFDPQVNLRGVYTPMCRGVSYWHDDRAAPPTACTDRIIAGTLDARLLALDAHTGKPCPGFGAGGYVDLRQGLGEVRTGEYYVTSAPLLVGESIVTGAFIRDGQRLNAPGGAVRAFDIRTGALRWVWDPVPPGMSAVTAAGLKAGAVITRGTPNVWGPMSADPERNLIFVATGNPSPDHFGGAPRGQKDYYGSSFVALDAASGALRWHFQTVHHDLWDYDAGAQPVLYEHRRGNVRIPALIGATKVGNIFLLDRIRGTPLFPVQERAVPASTVPGEQAAATQPFPTHPAPLHPVLHGRDDLWGLTFWDKHQCQKQFDALDYRGEFTPPSRQGTLIYPGMGGGINWGSVSVDPTRNRMIVNIESVAFVVKLVAREEFAAHGSNTGGAMLFYPQQGVPYIGLLNAFLSPWKIPCVPPPWGRLIAIDLDTGNKIWERPLGNLHHLAPAPIGEYLRWGTPNTGGSLQTAGGLVFIGATMDSYFRAFDADTGAELWRYELPFPAHATPMTFRLHRNGRQYVVIAAGGHGGMGEKLGDALVAFALP